MKEKSITVSHKKRWGIEGVCLSVGMEENQGTICGGRHHNHYLQNRFLHQGKKVGDCYEDQYGEFKGSLSPGITPQTFGDTRDECLRPGKVYNDNDVCWARGENFSSKGELQSRSPGVVSLNRL